MFIIVNNNRSTVVTGVVESLVAAIQCLFLYCKFVQSNVFLMLFLCIVMKNGHKAQHALLNSDGFY
jgi:hypothetical protein